MQAFYITTTQLLILTVLFVVGYIIKKKEHITDEGVSALSFVLLNVSTPATLFTSLQMEYSPQRLKMGVTIMACFMAVMVFGMGLAWAAAAALKITGMEKKVWLASGLVFNCFFIGAPITRALYGEVAMFYLCFGVLGWNLLAYAVLPRIFSGSGDAPLALAKRLLKTPTIVACFISLLVFAFQPPLPEFVKRSSEYLAQTTTPVSMLLLGALASGISFREIFSGKNVYILSALRLIIIPFVVIPLYILLLPEPTARNTVLIGAAMPVGTIVPVFAQIYSGAGALGTKYCIVSTLLALISLPLTSVALSYI